MNYYIQYEIKIILSQKSTANYNILELQFLALILPHSFFRYFFKYYCIIYKYF